MQRPARARNRNVSRRLRRGWIGVASLAAPLIVLALVLHGSSHTTSSTDSTPVVASVHEPGLTTLRHPVAATREIAAITEHASSDRARDSARRAATTRKQHRTSRRRRAVARVHHTAITTNPSPSDQTAVTPAAATSSPTDTTPASTATGSASTSNGTSAVTHGGGSPTPPVYGEGGVLGAGHGG